VRGEARLTARFPRNFNADSNPMSLKITIQSQGAPPAIGPYSHAVRVGDFLFCSGQIPIDPATGDLVPGDIQNQTTRVMENLKAILDHENLTFTDVVKTTVYLIDLADFGAMNRVYARYFAGEYPARTTVQAAGLPKGARLEIDAIVHYPGGKS
jgi:2-iminobutanoate/2-iminopropanoate deaminase